MKHLYYIIIITIVSSLLFMSCDSKKETPEKTDTVVEVGPEVKAKEEIKTEEIQQSKAPVVITKGETCFMKRFTNLITVYPEKEGLLQGFYAFSPYEPEEFLKRFEEFEIKYPDQVGLLQGFYSYSKHSGETFMARFDEFKEKQKERLGILQAHYSGSNHSLDEFIRRAENFENQPNASYNIDMQGFYAASSYTYDQFMQRVKDFDANQPEKGGLLKGFYAQSDFKLCAK